MTAKKQTHPTKRVPEKQLESDGTYLLKLVVCVLLGMFWLRFGTSVSWGNVTISALPVGFLVGLLLVNRLEKFQSDRKIWYAVLLIVTIISYFFPTGLIV